MRVCILTTSFPLKRGDLSGIFMLEQGRHLIRRGIEVQVVAPHHHGALQDEVVDGMSVHRFRYFLPVTLQRLCYGSGMPHNLNVSAWAKMQLPFLLVLFTLQALRYARYCDIIHAHWSPAGLAGLVAARVLGKPVVLTMHHGTTRRLTSIERLILEKVDHVLCNSSFTLAHIEKTARPRAVAVIPPGVDTMTFQPRGNGALRRRLLPNIPADSTILFTIGRLIGWKGHTFLINALRLLPDHIRAHLLIAGEGSLRQDLEDQVKRMGLSEKVTFLGHVPNHLTPLYYSLSDMYVQPSIVDQDGNTEGLGVTLLEAMACEVPCIGSKTGGIPDIIKDGRNGFLVDPADPVQLAERITMLAKDRALCQSLGRKARLFVEDHYSWTAKARELETIYTKLLSHEATPRG